MGGLLILVGGARAHAALGRPDERVHLDCGAGHGRGFGAVGFLDDYLKVTRASTTGCAALQDGRAGPRGARRRRRAARAGQQNPPLYNTRLIFPFFKNLIPDLGWFYVPFAAFVLVAWSNAVNLTDGLDGLAISTFAVPPPPSPRSPT
jgi:phospho-N-acetylmuramoyl-pentapeptide-transferase